MNGMYRSEAQTHQIKMALFFHDVIYDPARYDNEERSAEAFQAFAIRRGMNLRELGIIEDLILLTKSHKLGKDAGRAAQIMIDVDMCILGTPRQQYEEYARNVWREYSMHGAEKYREGRMAFLASVDPATLFSTPEMQVLTSRAERNLTWELETLEKNPKSILVD
jgi:predicted metal-dependent HD superfamily phosphohydrolase